MAVSAIVTNVTKGGTDRSETLVSVCPVCRERAWVCLVAPPRVRRALRARRLCCITRLRREIKGHHSTTKSSSWRIRCSVKKQRALEARPATSFLHRQRGLRGFGGVLTFPVVKGACVVLSPERRRRHYRVQNPGFAPAKPGFCSVWCECVLELRVT